MLWQYVVMAFNRPAAEIATAVLPGINIVINLLAVVVETTGLARCREAGRPPILLSNKSEAFVAHDNSAFGCTSFFTNISLYKPIACVVLATYC